MNLDFLFVLAHRWTCILYKEVAFVEIGKRTQTFKTELWLRFRINEDIDREDVQHPFLCLACQQMLYRVRDATEAEKIEMSKKLHSWRNHIDKNNHDVRPRNVFLLWIQARTSVLIVAINYLCHENIKPVQKAVTMDQICLVQPSYLSSMMFATNLLAYLVTCKKTCPQHVGEITLSWGKYHCPILI